MHYIIEHILLMKDFALAVISLGIATVYEWVRAGVIYGKIFLRWVLGRFENLPQQNTPLVAISEECDSLRLEYPASHFTWWQEEPAREEIAREIVMHTSSGTNQLIQPIEYHSQIFLQHVVQRLAQNLAPSVNVDTECTAIFAKSDAPSGDKKRVVDIFFGQYAISICTEESGHFQGGRWEPAFKTFLAIVCPWGNEVKIEGSFSPHVTINIWMTWVLENFREHDIILPSDALQNYDRIFLSRLQ